MVWLDHDLGFDSSGRALTVMPVVAELATAAKTGTPYRIGEIRIHTSNPAGALRIRRELQAAGYASHRWHDTRIFVNGCGSS
ncbi:MAG: hypothetical protein QOG33_705 [Gaiellales bacterium]|nr:hypothetical protein [Gaiellales bacterium]